MNQNPSKLELLYESIAIFAASDPLEGEKWHKIYKKYPELFKKLVKSNVKCEKEIAKVFKKYSKKVNQFVRWSKVDQLRSADEFDELLVPENAEVQKNFNKELTAAILIGLFLALESGGQHEEKEQEININWTGNSEPAVKFLRNYSLDLVKDLSKTTRNRMRDSLVIGIRGGESKADLAKRLEKIVGDTKRASLIADTESVRAFNQGRQLVLKELGFETYKIWLAQSDACPICKGVNGERKKLSERYSIGEYSPPAHPRCRCGENYEVKAS